LLVEHKHTSDGILAGLTVDWRHHLIDDWSYYKGAIVGIISTSLSGKRAVLAFLIQAKANVIAQDYY
jgi:hypothetical protein